MRLYSIGEVSIQKVGAKYGEGLVGAERVKELRQFYLDHVPSPGMEAIAYNPFRQVAWHEINWDTAGERVTR